MGKILNKLRQDLNKVLNLKAGGGVTITNNAQGITISAKGGGTDGYFGQLTDTLVKNGHVMASVWEYSDSTQQWQATSQQRDVYANPMQTDDLIQGTIVFVLEVGGKDVVITASCLE